jgi:blue copper oxidase
MKRIILLIIGFFPVTLVNAQNALQIPSTLSGKNITLNLQNGSKQFFTGQTASTMGANGNILGPTLNLEQGDFVNFAIKNQLADTTTIYWHGLHVSSENDGGPHTFILPGATWSPSFTILDKAATYWYHPHLHHHTDEHVSKGIAGLIIVKDKEEASLVLPQTYGSDDFPLVIQTKDFDANNQIMMHSNSDETLMVNATLDPFLNVH